jgi:hypothetical protein
MFGIRSRTIKGGRRLSALWHARSDLDRIVAMHRGHVVNKWNHYYEIYDRHFARFRDRDITVVEIGVAGGGSLDIWRSYFGPKARIFGLDNNPDCRRFESPGTRIVIGDQGDPAFLEKFAAETGPIDILIDDGSHAHDHQIVTFRALFKHIRDDGVYSCEDLFSSYVDEVYGGAPRKPGTFVEFLKDLIDEMNAWFWREGVENEAGAFASAAHGMHFYPTIVVIEKRRMTQPLMTPVGHTPQAGHGHA